MVALTRRASECDNADEALRDGVEALFLFHSSLTARTFDVTEEQIKYFLPGPTYVRRDVREAMLTDLVGHRSMEMRR